MYELMRYQVTFPVWPLLVIIAVLVLYACGVLPKIWNWCKGWWKSLIPTQNTVANVQQKLSQLHTIFVTRGDKTAAKLVEKLINITKKWKN